MQNLNPTAAKWSAEGWEPNCQDDYEWATNTGQYAPTTPPKTPRKARKTNTNIFQLRRQIVDMELEINCMRADYVRLGEWTNWDDPSLDARYDDICRMEDDVRRKRRQLKRAMRMVDSTPRPAA